MRRIIPTILFLLCSIVSAQAQSALEGKVTGRDSLPLPGVSIKNMQSGMFSISGNDGRFRIPARLTDTLLFTAIGYIPLATQAGLLPAVLRMKTQITQLPGIDVLKRTHTRDSMELREEYGKQFNFRRPKWYEVGMITPVGIGVNIHKLYKALSFRNNKRSDVFKERLISFEQQQFIDQRFTPALVARYTGLAGDSLTLFLHRCRPDFKFAAEAAEYDFILFIKEACARFRQPS